jgi:WD40 repeat protein
MYFIVSDVGFDRKAGSNESHRIAVNSLKFSPVGQWIASGGDDCLVKVVAMILISESAQFLAGVKIFLLSSLLIHSGAEECTGLLFSGYWGLSPLGKATRS